MKLIKELGAGMTKRAFLYEKDGEKIILLEPLNKKRTKWFRWQTAQEANVTQKLPPVRCDVRKVHISYDHGKWEVRANYVEGAPLSQKTYHELTNEQKDKLAADFADFLLTLNLMDTDRMDERYADERRGISLSYIIGALFHKLYCLKRRYLSLKNPGKNPFDSPQFRRTKEKILREHDFTEEESARIEQLVRTVNESPELFSYIGVCYHDFKAMNFMYDRKNERLGALDFNCLYKANIYEQFSSIYTWLGKDFTRRLVKQYNELSRERDAHLPKCQAYPLTIDYRLTLHYAAMRSLFFLLPYNPKIWKKLGLEILHELYPPEHKSQAGD